MKKIRILLADDHTVMGVDCDSCWNASPTSKWWAKLATEDKPQSSLRLSIRTW